MKDELIVRLRGLQGDKGVRRGAGVCHQYLGCTLINGVYCQNTSVGLIGGAWYDVTGQSLRLWFKEVLRDWPHYSGKSHYPILPVQAVTPIEEFDRARRLNKLWKGEYGRRRKELCGLMADYLEGLE